MQYAYQVNAHQVRSVIRPKSTPQCPPFLLSNNLQKTSISHRLSHFHQYRPSSRTARPQTLRENHPMRDDTSESTNSPASAHSCIPPHTPRYRRATGPTSAQGKVISSLNRLTHGCRSQQILLQDEDPAEFEATVRDWFEAYGPQDSIASKLVEQTALADWFLRRNQKRLAEIERSLPLDPCQWTDENHRSYTNFSRYKITAERSFIRNFKELEAHLQRDTRDAHAHHRALAQSARIFMRWLDRHLQSRPDRLRIRQWVEIHRDDDGRTRTTVSPTNAQIQQRVAAQPEPPSFLTRIVHFPLGVPPEYSWAFPDPLQQDASATAEQTIPYSDFPRLIAREASIPGGHIGPTDWLFDD